MRSSSGQANINMLATPAGTQYITVSACGSKWPPVRLTYNPIVSGSADIALVQRKHT